MVIHGGRKLSAKGFLSGLETMRFMGAGNCRRKVSCPMWEQCDSWGRKLLAKGFLSDVGTV